MPALSEVAAGGDADRTDFTCSRSPSPAWPSALRRRNPSAARSLFRKPPLRSWTCGTSSGRRLMAPASLHNNCEAASGTRECWSSMPDAWAGSWYQPLPGQYRRSTAPPATACRKLKQHRSTTRHRPCLFPRSRSNLQHRPDGTRRPLFSHRPTWATGRAGFAPAHPIAGGSGGRSQRSLP